MSSPTTYLQALIDNAQEAIVTVNRQTRGLSDHVTLEIAQLSGLIEAVEEYKEYLSTPLIFEDEYDAIELAIKAFDSREPGNEFSLSLKHMLERFPRPEENLSPIAKLVKTYKNSETIPVKAVMEAYEQEQRERNGT